jgi:1-acyl-sn-glycerol-3-phosphate acyltransferase
MGYFIMPFLHLFPGTRRQKQRRCQYLTSAAFRLFHRYLNVIGVMNYWPVNQSVRARIQGSIDGSIAQGFPGSVMVVANHPTLVDTCAIIASFPYLVCVVKSQVARFPLLLPLMHFCGYVSATATFGGSTAIADELIERLRQGDSVLLFPESTRSPDSGMGQFRRGPCEIAQRAQVPVQPIAIDAAPGLLKSGLAWYQLPRKKCHYRLLALEPLQTTCSESKTTGRSLANLSSQQIAQALGLQR